MSDVTISISLWQLSAATQRTLNPFLPLVAMACIHACSAKHTAAVLYHISSL